uniref:HTH_48 domain-containing protein n=1 Tax=Haemonchus contortus TaxID=6289 RepID=A0A7I4YKH9_HAECO
MDPTNPSIPRPIVYYEFLQGHSAREAANNTCAAFNKDVVHHSTVSRWYHRFESGDISIERQERPGPPSTLHDDDLRSALTSKPNITTRELATTLGCSKSIVSNRLASLGFRRILSTWVPHELRESDRACRFSIAESLLLCPHRKGLLNGMVTGDESWVLYINDTRKRAWLPKGELPPKHSKRGLQHKKILLCC